MNVTIHVAGALRPAVDGRRKVELGLPASADLGDLLQTLVTLYPRLLGHLPDEKAEMGLRLSILFQPRNALSPLGLSEGQRLYLVADQPRRLGVGA